MLYRIEARPGATWPDLGTAGSVSDLREALAFDNDFSAAGFTEMRP